jgi:hypothetical protein
VSKLQSLADRPATKDDVGKTIYWHDSKEIKEEIITKVDDKDIWTNRAGYSSNTKYLFWQPFSLVPESEYNELKEAEIYKEAIIKIGLYQDLSSALVYLSSLKDAIIRKEPELEKVLRNKIYLNDKELCERLDEVKQLNQLLKEAVELIKSNKICLYDEVCANCSDACKETTFISKVNGAINE